MISEYLDFFDEYVFKGLMPIAVFPGTKQPIEKAWNKNWCAQHWRKFFLTNDNYEVGLLWNNGMIDVETDTEESNVFLNKLIGGIERPIYKSHRSYHNIFLTPNKELTKVNLYGKRGEKIEIFGKRTFTMAPPSNHIEQGVKYKFVNDFWPPPPCPNGIKALYFQQKNIVIKSKDKTETACADCQRLFCLHKTRLAMEVDIFLKHKLKWKCVSCRKKHSIDVKEERRKLRKLFSRTF
jgi:hypothetical protein